MEEKRLTIGEHLEELRARVIVSLLAIAVIFVISVAFRKRVTTFWVRPVLDALGESKLKHIEPTGRLLSDLQLCLLTAVLLTICFPPFDRWYIAYVALVPWLLVLAGQSGRRWALLWGWLGGLIFWAVKIQRPSRVSPSVSTSASTSPDPVWFDCLRWSQRRRLSRPRCRRSLLP